MIITAYYLFFLLGLSSSAGAAAASTEEVEVTFLSFEAGNINQATFDKAAGTFISGPNEVNPLPSDDINPSSLVGRYIRNPLIQWDWSLFTTSAIIDASRYTTTATDDLVFQMDVLTYDAAIGTQIDITIEDTTVTATECFPLGRHSRYTAVTTVQGSWERLTFISLDRPDESVANDAINAIVISYAPGELVSGTFFVDNLVAVKSAAAPPTTSSPTTSAPVTSAPVTSPPPITPSPAVSTAILHDEFTTPNPWDTSIWQPRLPLSQSVATTGVTMPLALDGHGATLLYPKDRPATEWGPRYSTQIKSTEMNLYGKYESRLKSGRAGEGEGVISAFFIYRNDEVDYDGDGIHDNHEIDFELLNSDRSSIWCSVYTDYQYVNDVCTFHRNSARIDVATGEVWATVPGNEGNWDLVQIDSLDWNMPGFDHSASFYTYGFEWSENKVAFWMDLEDGVGRRELFEVVSDGSGGPNDHIPDMEASTFFNLWHTYVDWFSRADAPPMSVDTVMEIDYVLVTPISSGVDEPTSHPTTLSPVPAPTNSPTGKPTTIAPTSKPTSAPTNEPTPSPKNGICTSSSPVSGTSCSSNDDCNCLLERRRRRTQSLLRANHYQQGHRNLPRKTPRPTPKPTTSPPTSPSPSACECLFCLQSLDGGCSSDSDCCSGLICRADGVCHEEGVTCSTANSSCNSNSECCSLSCEGRKNRKTCV